jgi:hypothetical protein
MSIYSRPVYVRLAFCVTTFGKLWLICSLNRLDVYTALLNNQHIVVRSEIHVKCFERPVCGPKSPENSNGENGIGGLICRRPLGHDSVQPSNRLLPTLRRNTLPPYSGYKVEGPCW